MNEPQTPVDPTKLAELQQENAEYMADCQRLVSALRKSEFRFKALLYNLPEKVFHKDRDSVYVSCNRNYAGEFGLEPRQMVGKTDHDLFPHDIAVKYRTDDSRIMKSGGSEEIEESYYTPNGEKRLIRTVKAALRDEQGQVTGILGVFSDITEQKRAEQALRTSEGRYRALAETTGDIIYIVDRQGRLQYANPVAARCIGMSSGEIVGKGQADLFPPDVAQAHIERVERVFASGETLVEDEAFHFGPNEVWLCVHLIPLRDEAGQVASVMGVCHDITERKRAEAALQQARDELERRVEERTARLQEANELLQAEVEQRRQAVEALQESEQRMQMALKVSHSFAFEWDVATDRVVRSESCSSVLELSGDEALHDTGRNFFQRIHRDDRDRFLRMLGELTPSSDTYRTEYRVTRGDGTAVLEESARGFFNRDGTLQRLIGVTTDITGRKRAEEALRDSEAKYRALVESSPDAVVMCDLEGTILFASQRAAQQHGLDDAREMVGRHAIEFVVPEDRELVTANMRRLLKEKIRRNHQYRGLRRDGTTFLGDISASVIPGPSGEPHSLMGVYQDITERKEAEDALRERDAELLAAATIQAHLLPHQAPRFEGFDIAGKCYSASAAAGDHFDYLRRPDGSLLIVLADVSGHGLGPALVAADFSARIRTLSELTCELPTVAERIHAGLYRETAGELFVTAILGRLDPQSRTLACINAGHPPAILLDSAGREKARFESRGLPFAVLETTRFVVTEPVALEDGDLLLFYTDGLTEVQRAGGRQFGLDRAIQVVRDNQRRTAAEIIGAVHDAACAHIAPDSPKDDITVVVIKVQWGASDDSSSPEVPAGTAAKVSEPGHPGTAADVIDYASFAVESCGDVSTVRFVDTRHFDAAQYAQLQQDLVDFVERQRPHNLLIDLGNIEYCSTALINALVMAQRRVQAASGTMRLCGLNEVMLEALQHLKVVNTLFSVYPDVTAAKNACD